MSSAEAPEVIVHPVYAAMIELFGREVADRIYAFSKETGRRSLNFKFTELEPGASRRSRSIRRGITRGHWLCAVIRYQDAERLFDKLGRGNHLLSWKTKVPKPEKRRASGPRPPCKLAAFIRIDASPREVEIPESGLLADVAELIGAANARKLAATVGGARIDVPTAKRLADDHWLVTILSKETALTFCAVYGGESRLNLPRGRRTKQRFRGDVVEHKKQGRTPREIALILDMSERRVWSNIAAARQAGALT